MAFSDLLFAVSGIQVAVVAFKFCVTLYADVNCVCVLYVSLSYRSLSLSDNRLGGSISILFPSTLT
jgi:hypothetical protein